jgi:hypothetical protein
VGGRFGISKRIARSWRFFLFRSHLSKRARVLKHTAAESLATKIEKARIAGGRRNIGFELSSPMGSSRPQISVRVAL